MMEAAKNLFRRKTRTVLTVAGITVGIFAFIVMGSMAEKISLLVNGGTEYYADKVSIAAGDGGAMTAMPTPMPITKADEIAKVPGVAGVASAVYLPLSDTTASVSFGPPPAIIGSDFKGDAYESFTISYSNGRALKEGDNGNVVIGSDLVSKLNAKVGNKVTIRDRQYTVVGIIEKTLTAPDNEVWMTLQDAQTLAYKSLPEIVRTTTTAEQVVTGMTAYPKDGVDPDKLAKTIEQQVSDVSASGPQMFEDQIASATGVLNAILFGIALISLVVGGLSVINTMTMSISERIREIGIKKAVGAKTHHIMQEYLTEAGLIGLLGGLIGLALGAITVFVINQAMQESGNIIFLLTPRIAIIGVVFAVVLGVIAGIYPAYHAVKVNIVHALRED